LRVARVHTIRSPLFENLPTKNRHGYLLPITIPPPTAKTASWTKAVFSVLEAPAKNKTPQAKACGIFQKMLM
jgi:hypothetical protein